MSADPFPACYEYPDDDRILEGPKPGELFEYVSNTYLNGMVNYVKPARAWMVKRYRETGHAEAVAAIMADTIESGGRTVRRCHTKLRGEGMPIDDVVLVATSHEGRRVWMFYFDCDVSDCMIGCTEDASVDEVAAWAEGLENGVGCEIDVTSIRGWVSF